VGDSAGGGLAVAAMLYCRDTGLFPIPGAVGAMSPWLDLTQSLPAWLLNDAYDFLPHTALDPNHFSECRNNIYTSHDDELTEPYVSPVFAQEDPKHPISPMLVQIGEAER
jgi:acetyl esterase/lipase